MDIGTQEKQTKEDVGKTTNERQGKTTKTTTKKRTINEGQKQILAEGQTKTKKKYVLGKKDKSIFLLTNKTQFIAI